MYTNIFLLAIIRSVKNNGLFWFNKTAAVAAAQQLTKQDIKIILHTKVMGEGLA